MEGGVESAAFPSPPPPSLPPEDENKKKNPGLGRVPLLMSYIDLKLATSEVHPSVITLCRLPLVSRQNINR